MSEADKWLSQLKLAIDQPYPETVAEFAGWMHSEELETHLLHTPRRKTVLLMDQTGDYEYDEEMTLDGELELASQVDQFYAQVCQKISELYGAPLDLDLEDPSLQARIEPEDYDDDAERASYLSALTTTAATTVTQVSGSQAATTSVSRRSRNGATAISNIMSSPPLRLAKMFNGKK